MKNLEMKDIDHAFQPLFGNASYDYNVNGISTQNVNGFYYSWSNQDNKKIKEGFNFNDIFNIPNPIVYKSSKVKSNDTGYLKPSFTFITYEPYPAQERIEEYKKALKLFGLNENKTIKIDKISSITNYRDALLNQLLIQSKAIEEINIEISKVLKVYYYEAERLVLDGFEDLTEPEKKEKWDKWDKIFFSIKMLFQLAIIQGFKSETIINHWLPDKDPHSSLLPEELIKSTSVGVTHFCTKRDLMLDVAVKLAKKILPLEKILEDAFLNKEVTKANDEMSTNIYGLHQVNKEWVKNKWKELRRNTGSDRKADLALQDLYSDKFNGLSISTSQIQRYTGRQS